MADDLSVRKNGELAPQGDNSIVPVYGKVLEVTSETANFDINRILAKLMQYANMADALSNVERTTEYIVQIPTKYQEAFEVAINKTATKEAPWYVVPADHKWYMRLVISEIILASDMDAESAEGLIEETV